MGVTALSPTLAGSANNNGVSQSAVALAALQDQLLQDLYEWVECRGAGLPPDAQIRARAALLYALL